MRSVIAIVLVVLGALAIIAGIIYLTEPAQSLPSFMPGHLAHVAAKRTARGTAGLILGVVLLIVGVALWLTSGGPRRADAR
jgi:hypothetical protein